MKTSMKVWRAGGLLALILVGACSSGNGGTDDGGAGGLYGGVTVEILKDQYTGFLGTFFDGPSAPMLPLEPRQSQGGCTLYAPRAAACGGACPAGSRCGDGNKCIVEPAAVGVGVLHVTGLGGMARDAEPTSAATPSYQLVPTLPYPACAEGDAIGVAADTFALAAICVADLEVTSAVPIPVMTGQAVHLEWTPPAKAGASRVQVELEIAHHGGYKGQIDCDVPDTGKLDIPAPLVTALVSLGRAGYPTVKIARTSRGTTSAQPHLALTVASRVELEVDTGVISCGAGASPPCPTGTTCAADFTCR
jgi:hypothetical protein